MAYEASEITTAVALQYNSQFLKKVKTADQLKSMLKKGIGKDVEFATSSIKNGFLKRPNPMF